MDYLKEIELIITDLEASDTSAVAELREIYDYSFSGTELLLKSVHFLLGIKGDVNPPMKQRILELRNFCNSIGLLPGEE